MEFSAEEFETALITPNDTLGDIHIPLLKVGSFSPQLLKMFDFIFWVLQVMPFIRFQVYVLLFHGCWHCICPYLGNVFF